MREVVIGNRVKLARIEAGLTQKDLAATIGVTRQTVGLIEAQKYNPTIKLCLMIAKTTRKSLDDLFWIERMEA